MAEILWYALPHIHSLTPEVDQFVEMGGLKLVNNATMESGTAIPFQMLVAPTVVHLGVVMESRTVMRNVMVTHGVLLLAQSTIEDTNAHLLKDVGTFQTKASGTIARNLTLVMEITNHPFDFLQSAPPATSSHTIFLTQLMFSTIPHQLPSLTLETIFCSLS
jgi:hypothetical protein